MLSNAYFLAKFRFDTAENEPAKNLQNLARILNFANLLLLGSGAHAAAQVLLRIVGPELGSCQFSAKFWQNVARFRLYRHRFLQENTRFAAFFKIYQII